VAATLFGVMLFVLGTVNQLIRRPPIVVDLTLQTGNGGFIVLGAVLAFVGVTLRRLKTRPAALARRPLISAGILPVAPIPSAT
jgi:hypothetical protein